MPSPKLIGSYGQYYYDGVEVVGNTAYLYRYDQLSILDISDPTKPTLKAEYQPYDKLDSSFILYGGIKSLAVQGSTAYLIDEYSNFEVIDFSNPNKPVLKEIYKPELDESTALVLPGIEAIISGSDIYIPSINSNLEIVDISDISNPESTVVYNTVYGTLRPVPTEGHSAREITISGSYAYIVADSDIQILDISEPANPTFKGKYDRPQSDYGYHSNDRLSVSGNYAYFFHDDAGLEIIDVSDPTKPVLKGTYATNLITTASGKRVKAVGQSVYIVDSDKLQVLDITDPVKPILKGTYSAKSPSSITDLEIAGNYAFLSTESSGLQIIQLTDNTPPSAFDRTINLEVNTPYTFTPADFQFTDFDLDNTLKTVQITALTSQGELFLDANDNKQNDGESVALNLEIAIADLPKLIFKPQRDKTGSNYDTFQFKVSDGIAYSSQAYTIAFNVNPPKKEPEPQPEPEKEFTEIKLTPTYLPDGVDPNYNPCLLIYNPPAIPSLNLTTDTRTVPAFVQEGYSIFFGDEGYNTIDAETVSLAAMIGNAGNDNLFGSPNIGVSNNDGDVILGNQGADYIDAKAGNDIVFGGQDNDFIRGNDGDDALLGDLGNDLILGDAGNDGLSGMEGIDYLNGGSGNDVLNGGDDNDAAVGGDGNDRLLGDAGNDCMSGQTGDDLLFGGSGVDLLNGDAGNDTLYGGKDKDTLFAGAGNDLLLADLGNDVLIGGTGGDRFDFRLGDGFDVIADFQDGADIIGLRGFSFGELTIAQFGSDTQITATGLIVILQRVSSTAIDASDFASV